MKKFIENACIRLSKIKLSAMCLATIMSVVMPFAAAAVERPDDAATEKLIEITETTVDKEEKE